MSTTSAQHLSKQKMHRINKSVSYGTWTCHLLINRNMIKQQRENTMNKIEHKTERATPIHVVTNKTNGACLLFDRKGLGINSTRWAIRTGLPQRVQELIRSLTTSQKLTTKNRISFSSVLSASLR